MSGSTAQMPVTAEVVKADTRNSAQCCHMVTGTRPSELTPLPSSIYTSKKLEGQGPCFLSSHHCFPVSTQQESEAGMLQQAHNSQIKSTPQQENCKSDYWAWLYFC